MFLSSKFFLAVCLIIIALIEIRRGFLTRFSDYWSAAPKKKYGLALLAAIIFALSFLPLDESILRKVQSIDHLFLLEFVQLGAWLGRANGMWGVAAVLFVAAWIIRKRDWQLLCFGALVSGALTGLMVHIIKHISMRARPLLDLGPYHFFDFHGIWNEAGRYQSFPSGDVSTTAGVAVFFFLSISKKYSWAFLIFPFLTMISRMHLNKHWPSDTLAALLLSFVVGKFVWDYMKFLKIHPPSMDLSKKKI